MDTRQLALEELRLLQEIIKHQEELRAQLTNWAVGLIGAVTVAFLSTEISLSRFQFLFVGCTLVFASFWMNVIYRVAQNRAIVRGIRVEHYLREGNAYDGPRIGASLAVRNSVGEQLRAAANIRMYAPYSILLAFLIAASFVAADGRESRSESVPQKTSAEVRQVEALERQNRLLQQLNEQLRDTVEALRRREPAT